MNYLSKRIPYTFWIEMLNSALMTVMASSSVSSVFITSKTNSPKIELFVVGGNNK